MPPISRLTPEQAMDHFLCGYTAKVAGTEVGVTKPQAAFSACFAAPFLPLHPRRYAAMLREKLHALKVPVWLLNTGWTGRRRRRRRAHQPEIHAGYARRGVEWTAERCSIP